MCHAANQKAAFHLIIYSWVRDLYSQFAQGIIYFMNSLGTEDGIRYPTSQGFKPGRVCRAIQGVLYDVYRAEVTWRHIGFWTRMNSTVETSIHIQVTRLPPKSKARDTTRVKTAHFEAMCKVTLFFSNWNPVRAQYYYGIMGMEFYQKSISLNQTNILLDSVWTQTFRPK